MDDSSNCSFPVIEIDSKTNSPLRLDENLISSDEITVINPEIEAITKIHGIQKLTQYFLFLQNF